jgi:hypothetical protein
VLLQVAEQDPPAGEREREHDPVHPAVRHQQQQGLDRGDHPLAELPERLPGQERRVQADRRAQQPEEDLVELLVGHLVDRPAPDLVQRGARLDRGDGPPAASSTSSAVSTVRRSPLVTTRSKAIPFRSRPAARACSRPASDSPTSSARAARSAPK